MTIPADVLTREFARAWGWSSPPIVEWDRQGVNRILRVRADDGLFYVRVVDERRRASREAEAEAVIVAALAAAGAPITAVRRTIANAGWCRIDGGSWAICFAAAPGVVEDPPTVERYALVGAAIARFHVVGERIAGRIAADGVLADPTATGPMLARAWRGHRELERALAEAAKRWRMHARADVGAIHGDCHTGNCVFDGERVLFVDSECVGVGPRAYDLAVIRSTIRAKHPDGGTAAWESFLDGYRRIRPLAAAVEAEVPLAMALREQWKLVVAALAPWRYEPVRFAGLADRATAAITAALA